MTKSTVDKKPSKEELNKLFEEFHKTGDPAIRDQLIEKNMYLCDILARKYVNRGIDFDDIYQVACIGLILAVDRFEPSKGYAFTSYATPTIMGEIKRHFRDKGWTIKVPRRIQEQSKKISNAKIHLSQVMGEAPTAKDIADFLDMSEEEVIEVMEASKVYTPGSLDISIESNDDGSELFLSDVIGDDDPTYDRIENLDFIKRELENLNEIERTIIIERFINRKTQIAIAQELGISQMTVSRIEKRVIKELQKSAIKNGTVENKSKAKN